MLHAPCSMPCAVSLSNPPSTRVVHIPRGNANPLTHPAQSALDGGRGVDTSDKDEPLSSSCALCLLIKEVFAGARTCVDATLSRFGAPHCSLSHQKPSIPGAGDSAFPRIVSLWARLARPQAPRSHLGLGVTLKCSSEVEFKKGDKNILARRC